MDLRSCKRDALQNVPASAKIDQLNLKLLSSFGAAASIAAVGGTRDLSINTDEQLASARINRWPYNLNSRAFYVKTNADRPRWWSLPCSCHRRTPPPHP